MAVCAIGRAGIWEKPHGVFDRSTPLLPPGGRPGIHDVSRVERVSRKFQGLGCHLLFGGGLAGGGFIGVVRLSDPRTGESTGEVVSPN